MGFLFLLAFGFSCTPLLEDGGFEKPGISIYSTSSQTAKTEGTDKGGNSDNEDSPQPKGKEFEDEPVAEDAESPPITRGLY